jgi:tetratricopeptide (TPR) repeat protein
VRQRFFALSKRYHPDRAFDAPPAVKELMENVFRKVQEAYEIASDPRRREEYLSSKDKDKAGLDARALVNAEIAFTQGELYLKNRNYAKAREFFQEAVNLNAYAVEFKAYLGWSIFLDDPGQFTEAAKTIHEAIKANPNLDRGYYFLGCIFKARNEMSQAENAFKKAVAVNAGNVDAQRELRLLALRKDKPGSAPAPSKPASSSARPTSSRPEAPVKKGFFDRFKKS